MSGRFVTLCVVGLLGSLFVGYCVYFDRKRRSDPDYKKKVLASKYFSDPLSRALYTAYIYRYDCTAVWSVDINL